MAAKYVLLIGALIFLGWAGLAALRNGGRLTPGGRTHLLVALIFLLVSTYLFWTQRM